MVDDLAQHANNIVAKFAENMIKNFLSEYDRFWQYNDTPRVTQK